MRIVIFSFCFLLAQHVFGQSKSDLSEDLAIIKTAFSNTNTRLSVVTNSTERIGFWGTWEDGRLITQVDDKETEGQYLLNPNPRGAHDFYLQKNHRREQIIPVGRGGQTNVASTAKTRSETLFLNGRLRMRFNEASVAIFRRVPKGWFNVETFKPPEMRLPPAASYLKAVDYQFILRQNTLLDLSLLQKKYISDIEPLSGEEVPGFVSGRCFSIKFTDPDFALRSSLGVGANDFSGFEFTETFRNDLFRNATIFFRVCITADDARTEPLVLFTEASRSGSDIPTRLAGKDITMRFLGQKEVVYEYVDASEINFPDVQNSSTKSRLLHGLWALGAALLLFVL